MASLARDSGIRLSGEGSCPTWGLAFDTWKVKFRKKLIDDLHQFDDQSGALPAGWLQSGRLMPFPAIFAASSADTTLSSMDSMKEFHFIDERQPFPCLLLTFCFP